MFILNKVTKKIKGRRQSQEMTTRWWTCKNSTTHTNGRKVNVYLRVESCNWRFKQRTRAGCY